MFESEPLEASENRIKGIAVLVKLNIKIYLKLLIKSFKSFGLIKRGRNTSDAVLDAAVLGIQHLVLVLQF